MIKTPETLQAEASNDDQQKLLQTKTLLINDFIEINGPFMLRGTSDINLACSQWELFLLTLEGLPKTWSYSADHDFGSLRIKRKRTEGIDLKVFGNVLGDRRKVLHHFEQWGIISLRTTLILRFTYLKGGEMKKISNFGIRKKYHADHLHSQKEGLTC